MRRPYVFMAKACFYSHGAGLSSGNHSPANGRGAGLDSRVAHFMKCAILV